MTAPVPEELARLRKRVQKLAREKSQLELVLDLLDNLAPVSGLEATITRVLELVMNTLGGTNVALHYRVGDQWQYADIHGTRETHPDLTAPVPRRIVSTGTSVITAAADQTIATGHDPVLAPAAQTWGFPLTVGDDTFGCLMMEGVLIAYHSSIGRQFEVFTQHLALTLRNEIHNYRKLEEAYEDLRTQHDALKRVSAQWRRTEERLERAQRVGRIGSWELDLDTHQAYWSAGMFELCGLPPPPEGTPPDDFDALVVPEDRDAYRTGLRRALQNRDLFEMSFRLHRPDGEIRHLEVYGEFSHDRHSGTRRLVGVARDVTTQVEARIHREGLEAQLRQAQKMEAIGTLAGGIAHDFNNILSGISGFTELTQLRLPRDSTETRNLDRVMEAVARARDLVQQILTFSRHTAERKEPVAAVPLVEEALKLLEASIPTTIEIRASLEPAAGRILADPTQIHQVVINLCTNAYHAMRRRGGVLEVTLRAVDVPPARARRHPGLHGGPHLELTVADTGPGVPAEVIPRIFEPFFTTKAAGEGTGMGLAMAHGIVRGHGGIIEVTNRPSGGARFTVLLPMIQTAAHTRPEPKPIYGGTEHILVVDDEPILIDVETMMLESLGYRVTAFTEVHSALQAFRTDPGSFDLLLSDQTMPGMTGTELAYEILATRPDLPVVLCTGHSETLDGTRAREIGAHCLLMKPVRLQSLARAVRSALNGDPLPPA